MPGAMRQHAGRAKVRRNTLGTERAWEEFSEPESEEMTLGRRGDEEYLEGELAGVDIGKKSRMGSSFWPW